MPGTPQPRHHSRRSGSGFPWTHAVSPGSARVAIIVGLSLVVVGLGIVAWVFLFPSDDDNGNGDPGPVIRPLEERKAFLSQVGKMIESYRAENNGRYPYALLELIRYADDRKAFRDRIGQVLYRPLSRRDRTEPQAIIACDATDYFDKQRCVLHADGSVEALPREPFNEALTLEENAPMARRIKAVAAFRAAGEKHSRARGVESVIRTMCQVRLKNIGNADAMHRAEHRDRPAADLMIFLEEGYVPSAEMFFCPASSGPDGGYFYWPARQWAGNTMVACDKAYNHNTYRNALFADSHVESLSAAGFADALARPDNADFAAALKVFEGR